jgi:AbrB family looped-hinge helix DNA binding protein
MVKTSSMSDCCAAGATSCCRVEAVVAVDERGQMILPKEIRQRAGIAAGDKLALVTIESGNRVCCMALIKADELREMVSTRLGPVLQVLGKQ